MERKYLEYFEGAFDSTVADKMKPENKPYVAYSKTEGVAYTVVPKPVIGPADNEIWYTSSDGDVVNPDDTSVFGANIVSNIYENGQGVITFDGDVTSIRDAAFEGCSSLTSVTIPNSVTSIGYSAFEGCSSLTSVTIPNSVTSIGEHVFADCSSLTSITIPNSVTSIDSYAFLSCSSLTSITIPNSVTSIGDNAFYGCSGLTSIIVEDANSTYDSRENCNAIIETTTNTLIAGCQNTIIPNSVTRIGDYAFYDRSDLTSVTIPNSVTSIGDYAFYDCSDLNSITYEGTQEQWNSITKGSDWNYNAPATHVQCSDGQVAL